MLVRKRQRYNHFCVKIYFKPRNNLLITSVMNEKSDGYITKPGHSLFVIAKSPRSLSLNTICWVGHGRMLSLW